jgi:small subunit ribosomal protein S3
MIERKFVSEKMRELLVQSFMAKELGKGKYSYFEIKKTPLGEKIIIYTSRPGLIVGKKGENIKHLTQILKSKFKMENPQIEVSEVYKPDLDAKTVAEQIVNTLERFGPKRFKAVGYRSLQRIMDAGAMGAEIVISGRGVPSSRAKSWRFYAGYLKKSGDIAQSEVIKGECVANLKSGSIGIKVSIMHPDIVLPDKIEIYEVKAPTTEIMVEEISEEETKEVPKEEAKEKSVKKKTIKKKAPKKEVVKKAPKKEVVKKAPKKEVVKEAPKKEVVKEAPKKEVVKEAPKKEVVKEAPKEEVKEVPKEEVKEEKLENDENKS